MNSINSMAATSGHAKVINKHPQMAANDSLQSDTAARTVSGPVGAEHSSVCLTVQRRRETTSFSEEVGQRSPSQLSM